MATIVLPDVDRSTIDDILKRVPNLSEVELPSMENFGKHADATIDRLRGRSRTPAWPWWAWIATGLGLVAVVGAIAALMNWRRSSTNWSSGTTDPWTEDALTSMDRATDVSMGGGYGTTTTIDVIGSSTDLTGSAGASEAGSGLGLSAAEASLMSTDPIDDRGI